MGTRTLVHFEDKDEIFCTVYRQFDGYPSGMGQDIFDTLGHRELVNGYSDASKQANGMDDAAALLVRAIKDPKAGNVYIKPAGLEDVWEDYVYVLRPNGKDLHLTIFSGMMKDNEIIFDDLLRNFNAEKVEG